MEPEGIKHLTVEGRIEISPDGMKAIQKAIDNGLRETIAALDRLIEETEAKKPEGERYFIEVEAWLGNLREQYLGWITKEEEA